MVNPLPTLGYINHTRRVCRLYKSAIRTLESYYDRRNVFRYQAVLMRERFDKNAKECDMRKVVEMVKAGEEELFKKQHPNPKKFAPSPGGVAYQRVVPPPDWVLDYWHPLEKAQYPEYFKRREQRKKEFVQLWEQQYGKYNPKDDHH